MVILDQSKPIAVYLKRNKIENQKYVNCTFIIHKNGNTTSIQPILKSNSTSFMINNIFFEMRGKKSYPLGGLGEWENRHYCVLEV